MRTDLRLVACVLATVVAWPLHLDAQDANNFRVGTRVRVTAAANDSRQAGEVLVMNSDSLIIRAGDETLLYHRADVSRLEFSNGRYRRPTAGLGLGVLIGVGMGIASGYSRETIPHRPRALQGPAGIGARALVPLRLRFRRKTKRQLAPSRSASSAGSSDSSPAPFHRVSIGSRLVRTFLLPRS